MHDSPPLCAARRANGDPCGNFAVTDRSNVVGSWLDLCDRHVRRFVDEMRLHVLTEKTRIEAELFDLHEYQRRVERAKVRYTNGPDGWSFEFTLPRTDPAKGRRGKRIRRSGFRRKLDASRAAEHMKRQASSPERAQELADRLEAVEAASAPIVEAVRSSVAGDRLARASVAARERRERERTRLVYYVRRPSDQAIKIGTTWNITTRMAAFRNVTPVELLAVHTGGQPAEAALHRRFRHLRLDGEWFRDAPELIRHITHVQERTAA